MNYQEAKAKADALWEAIKIASEALQAFPKGLMGMTPDDVKASAEWKLARSRYDYANAEFEQYHRVYSKEFHKEIVADRASRRTSCG